MKDTLRPNRFNDVVILKGSSHLLPCCLYWESLLVTQNLICHSILRLFLLWFLFFDLFVNLLPFLLPCKLSLSLALVCLSILWFFSCFLFFFSTAILFLFTLWCFNFFIYQSLFLDLAKSSFLFFLRKTKCTIFNSFLLALTVLNKIYSLKMKSKRLNMPATDTYSTLWFST